MAIEAHNLPKVIRKNFVRLTTEYDFEELIKDLFEKKLISPYDYESLISKTRIKKNEEFLLNIDMYGDTVANELSTWLQINHPEMYYILCSTKPDKYQKVTNEDLERRERDRDIIRNECVMLLKRINALVLAPQLFQDGFLGTEDLENIYVQPTRRKRGFELLVILISSRRAEALQSGLYKSFTEALRMHQPHLYADFVTKVLATSAETHVLTCP